jgi:hypothetical protein
MGAALALLGRVPWRCWIYVAAAAAISVVLLREHHAVHKLNEERVSNAIELRDRDAKIKTRDARIADLDRTLKLQWDASNAYQQALEDLRAQRDRTPSRAVRLCIGAQELPSAAGGSGETRREELPAAPRPGPQVGRDIGPELYQLADEADRCAAQRDALIDWVIKSATTP